MTYEVAYVECKWKCLILSDGVSGKKKKDKLEMGYAMRKCVGRERDICKNI